MDISRRDILKMGLAGFAAVTFAGGLEKKILAAAGAQSASAAAKGNLAAMVLTDTSKSQYAKLISIGVNAFSLESPFWKPKIEVNHKVSIPHQYKECERTGRINNFRFASGDPKYSHEGFIFNDSDVYKWAEAASYDLALRPSEHTQKNLDEFIRLVAASQQPDGYLNTAFMGDKAKKRWSNVRDEHELYCGGHMVQAAIAHYRTTGKTNFLDVANKWADCVHAKFGKKGGRGTSGHPEIEMALIELYRATGDKRRLDQAEIFLERRGRPSSLLMGLPALQDHAVIRKQTTMTGHAVRQFYLLSGEADLYAEKGDEKMMDAMQKQWDNFTGRKMYVTGGAGSDYEGESFGEDYVLPNRTAYCETCASIAAFMWNWRMLQLTAEARFADVMEREIYNGVLSGVSLDGRNYFYTNPLEHDGGKDLVGGFRGSKRRTSMHWDGCACCPPNMARTLAELPAYFYGISKDAPETVYIHHYSEGTAKFDIGGAQLGITQKTDFPWDGKVSMTINCSAPVPATLMLRIPAWCEKASVKVNETDLSAAAKTASYLKINRAWSKGDRIEADFPMSIRRIAPHPNVKENTGKVALARGPIVYCIEGVDFGKKDIFKVALPDSADLKYSFDKELLGGVGVLEATAKCGADKCDFKAVPYFAWANRKPGALRVWIPTA